MPYETLLLEINENIATLTMNRPKVLNALNAAMLRELNEAIQALGADPAVRVIVLRGAGGKAFAAGADITELAAADASTGEQLAGDTQRIFRRLEILGKPVIACVDGYALGGGCELAMACTLRVANDAARLGQPEIKLGLIPGYGGSQRLPRLVGRGAALKMLLTGAIIDGAEAFRIGLVDELVHGDSAALLSHAVELASSIAQMPPLAVTASIEAVDQGADMRLDDAVALEARIFGRLCGSEDKREGTRAFLEKRAPVWTGR
jgi:enoyl-CoA hydratase